MNKLRRIIGITLATLMFVTASISPAFAAISYETNVTRYLSSTGGTGSAYIYVSGLAAGQSIVKSSIKSSNAKVVRPDSVENSSTKQVKITKYGYAYTSRSGNIGLTLLKKGTATVSYKVGKKTCKTNVKVLGYVNPVKSLKIAGSKNIAAKFKSNSYVSGKAINKSGKIAVTAASGWKVTNIYYSSSSTGKSWSHNPNKVASASLNIPAKIGKGYLSITFENTKTGGSIYTTYDMS